MANGRIENVSVHLPNDPKSPFTVVKRTLNSILSDINPNKEIIQQAIDDRVDRVTRIAYLASTLFMYECYKAVENGHFNYFNAVNNRNIKAIDIIKACYYKVTNSTDAHYVGQLQQNEDIWDLFQTFGIDQIDNSYFGNIMNYSYGEYKTNCENNITMHFRQRLKKFFKVIANTPNNNFPNLNQQTIDDTLKYMCDTRATVQPNLELIHQIPYWEQLRINDQNIIATPGFFLKFIDREENWFKAIPLFIKIQWAINDYQILCRTNEDLPNVKNFVVIPQTKHTLRHIRIDNEALFRILTEFKMVPPSKTNKKRKNDGTQAAMNVTEFIKHKEENWYKILDENKIRQAERQKGEKQEVRKPKKGRPARRKGKKKGKGAIVDRTKAKAFNYQIVTNGVSASVFYINNQRERAVKPNGYLQNVIPQKLQNHQYRRLIGVDPGYKVWTSAVIRYPHKKKESNYEVPSKMFHGQCGMSKRQKKQKDLTAEFEARRNRDALDRDLYEETPSPNSRRLWFDYIEWRLRFYDEGMAYYAEKEYARTYVDKFIQTQTTMDKVTNELVGNDPSLICIGSTDFNPNAPIKKYIRCPGAKMLQKYLKKKRAVDVLRVDEYMTSQTCGYCHEFFDWGLLDELGRQKQRFRICQHANCQPPPEDPIGEVDVIIAKRNRRILQAENRAYPHIYFNQEQEHQNENIPNEVQPDRVIARRVEFPNQRVNITNRMIVKTNHVNLTIQNGNQRLTWNRDISAARNILYKGLCAVMQIPMAPTLDRRNQRQHSAQKREYYARRGRERPPLQVPMER